MATVLENIIDMNSLVAAEKKRTRLTETTILRVIDMNLALAQRGGNPLMDGATPPVEDEDDEEIVFPEPNETGIPVEDDEAEDNVIHAVFEPTPDTEQE